MARPYSMGGTPMLRLVGPRQAVAQTVNFFAPRKEKMHHRVHGDHSAAFGRNPIVGVAAASRPGDPRPSAARPYIAREMFARKVKNYDLVSQRKMLCAYSPSSLWPLRLDLPANRRAQADRPH
jgi:hypothetical protein